MGKPGKSANYKPMQLLQFSLFSRTVKANQVASTADSFAQVSKSSPRQPCCQYGCLPETHILQLSEWTLARITRISTDSWPPRCATRFWYKTCQVLTSRTHKNSIFRSKMESQTWLPGRLGMVCANYWSEPSIPIYEKIRLVALYQVLKLSGWSDNEFERYRGKCFGSHVDNMAIMAPNLTLGPANGEHFLSAYVYRSRKE